jgi:hypothetical protein
MSRFTTATPTSRNPITINTTPENKQTASKSSSSEEEKKLTSLVQKPAFGALPRPKLNRERHNMDAPKPPPSSEKESKLARDEGKSEISEDDSSGSYESLIRSPSNKQDHCAKPSAPRQPLARSQCEALGT